MVLFSEVGETKFVLEKASKWQTFKSILKTFWVMKTFSLYLDLFPIKNICGKHHTGKFMKILLSKLVAYF